MPPIPFCIAARASPPWRSRPFLDMARAWDVAGDSWEGSQYGCGNKAFWIEVQKFATFVGGPRESSRVPSIQIQAAASCRCAPTSGSGGNRDHQGLLGKTFYQDYANWWDSGHQKRDTRPFDFWYKEFREDLCVTKHKPPLGNAGLANLETLVNNGAFAASPWHVHRLIDPGFDERVTPESVKILCQKGQAKAAVEALEVLVGMNVRIDKYLFYYVLKVCVVNEDLFLGAQVHALAVTMGLGSNTFLCNHFIRMYASHGKLQNAMDVFGGVALPDAFMWSSIISAHVKQNQAQRAVQLYQNMRATRVKPNGFVFVAALQACTAAGDLQFGKQVHDDVLNSETEPDMFVCNCLVDMYAKCGSLKHARRVFDTLDSKDVVTYNVMIAGYAKVEGMGQEALNLYSAMLKEGNASPNAVTFIGLSQACANVGSRALDKGKELHLQLQERRLECDVVVACSLVNMYVKCGSLKDARIIFDGLDEKNVVTWNAMLSGYAQQEGMGKEALCLYDLMHNEGVVAPNAVTFVCLLQACANVGVSALETGKQLHSQLKDLGLESDVVVGGSLVNMYAKCGSLKDAHIVFDGLGEKTVVTWNAMICGYAQEEGMGQEALKLYSAMCEDGLATPNAVTYMCLLEACATVGALQQGKQLHTEIRERGFEPNVFIGTCLVKMYAKCGCLDVSRQVFDSLPTKSLVSWNALLKGYAEHGEGGMAIQCFEELLQQGIQPNKVTFTCLFTACSHAGLVDQGQQYFKTMVEQHRVQPDDWHYNCMVDLLGRSGHLDKAERMLQASGLASDVVSWKALLSACKRYGDAETGKRCFDHLVKLEPTVATGYVLLGSLYANAGKWHEVEKVESLRFSAGARKVPGKACIEVKKVVHEFTVGEERSDVVATLSRMNKRIREGGHVPQIQLVLRPVSAQEKEDALCGHAEKLALAYGLLNTPAGSTLVVTKNLRMCNDCHSSTKVMSQLEKREIVVRDGHKVHRFRNGACSCQDRP